MKKQTKIAAVRWCLRHMYAANEDAACCDEFQETDDGFDDFLAEIQRLTKPLEKRLLDLQREV